MTDENDNIQSQFRAMTVSRDFKHGIQPFVRLYEQYKQDGTINKSDESRALLDKCFPIKGYPVSSLMLEAERIEPEVIQTFYDALFEHAEILSVINERVETEDRAALRVLSNFIRSALDAEQMKNSEMVTSLVVGLLSAIDRVEDAASLSHKELAKVVAFQARSIVGKDNASGVKLTEGYAKAKALFNEWVDNPKKYSSKSKFYLALISSGCCENTSTGERWIKDFIADLDPCCPLGQVLLKKK